MQNISPWKNNGCHIMKNSLVNKLNADFALKKLGVKTTHAKKIFFAPTMLLVCNE